MAITVAATVSGNEITDAVRTTNTQGDGRTPPDSSYGIWESTTNLLINGNADTNTTNGYIGVAEWTTTRATTGAGDPVKFGTTAYKITHNAATNADNNMGNPLLSAAMAASTTYCYSLWIYVPSSWDANGPCILGPNGNAGTGGTADNTHAVANLALRDQWQRIWTVVTTGTSPGVGTPATLRTQSTYPSVGQFIYVAGAQVEARSYPTPYVDTHGAAASRSRGRVRIPAPLINPTQGWFAVRMRMPYSSSAVPSSGFPCVWMWNEAGNQNNIGVVLNSGGTGAYVQRVVNGVFVTRTFPAFTWAQGDLVTFVMTWTAAQIASSGNGAVFATAVTTNAGNTQPLVDIGSNVGGAVTGGEYYWVAGGTGTLVNADSATLNGFGNTDPTMAQLAALNGGAANPTFLWTADTTTVNLPSPAMLTLSAGVVTTPTNTKQVAITRAVPVTASLTRLTSLQSTVSLAVSFSLSVRKTAAKSLSALVSVTPSLKKAANLTTTVSANVSLSVNKSLTLTNRVGVAVQASVRKAMSRVFSLGVQIAPSLARTFPGQMTVRDSAVTSLTVTDTSQTILLVTDRPLGDNT